MKQYLVSEYILKVTSSPTGLGQKWV